jgi:hypothetical protein
MAKVEHTKTGSRNKVEFGTIGPLPREAQTSEEDDDFSDIPF